MQATQIWTPSIWPFGPRLAPLTPWSEVHVDSIGNWQICIKGQTMKFNALTMIDPVTNLREIAHMKPTKTSVETAHVFETTWLSHYP